MTGGTGDDMADQRATIRTFVAKHIGGAEFADEDDLFATGYVNSLFAVQIVMFTERTFGLAVVGPDLDIANFSSVDRIDTFVTKALNR
ncbi:acyl carrier protein [Amycolatopsis sp. NPDC049252]|uniref:acyl carrier protein n=1 Tax=Amycolatopsis sp. NPDC049252 TaxID=3363933 RepID=UPI00371725A4